MAYGISIENESNELVISDSGVTFGYIGQASLTSVIQPSESGTNGVNGFSQYTISYAGAIAVAVRLTANRQTTLLAVNRSGNTYTISVDNGIVGTANALGFLTQEATQVYVFGYPSSVSGYGFAIYDDAGNVVANLIRQPLFFRTRLIVPDGSFVTLPSGISVPAFIGLPSSSRRLSGKVTGAATFTRREYNTAWILSDTNTIAQTFSQREYSIEDADTGSVSTIRPAFSLILDAGLLRT